MSEERISYLPTEGLTYDPEDQKYWSKEALDKEIKRAFEICHGCRMCFKYCDSFPSLFSFLDDEHDGNVHKITAKQTKTVMDACFQCKLCEVQCPYTPRDGHEFQLDFPKLVHRYKAQEQKEHGNSLRDKVLSEPDLAGKAARASFGLVNHMNKLKAHRWFMEKILGIHQDKLLPEFSDETFESWADKNNLIGGPDTKPEAVLFQTCYVQNNEPQIGQDTIAVLQRNQVKVQCERGLQCCGMPKWESGDLKGMQRQAIKNLKTLLPYVKAGAKVLAINPTCSMMMRKEYPDLLPKEHREDAKLLAASVMDPSEFLWSIREETRFNTNFESSPGETVGYHAPCHLRAQSVGFKGRDLLRKIPGVVPKMVLECCGHDGTYAMKKEGFEASKRAGQKSFAGMQSTQSEVWSTDCPLAAIQFEQHAGIKPMHPMSILARAYEPNGFNKQRSSDEKS